MLFGDAKESIGGLVRLVKQINLLKALLHAFLSRVYAC